MKSLAHCRVLVVDDVEENLWIAEELLRNTCLVTTLQDGTKTLETALRCRPDLILLDIVMPGCDGIGICRTLKDDSRTQNIPVIFLSSLAEESARVEGFNAGGLDFVGKPFFEEELLARVRAHLRITNMEQELRDHNEYLKSALESTEENYVFFSRTTTDILVQINASAAVSLVNPAWTNLTGQSTGDLIGKSFHDTAIPEDALKVWEELTAALSDKKRELRLQYRIPGKTTPVWVLATLKILYDEQDAFLGAAAVLCDIGELVEKNEDLSISKEGIEKAHMETMENLAHDLRSPLQALAGGLLLLEGKYPAEQEIIETFRTGYDLLSASVSSYLTSPVPMKIPTVGVSRQLPADFSGPILLLDDSLVNLRLLQHILKNLGFYDVDLVQSGEDALGFWIQRNHPLVLLDLKLPGMDGYEVCRKIRACDGGSFPIIVAVSASAIPENAEKCRQCGFDGQISKPVSVASLSDALTALGRYVATSQTVPHEE